MTNHSSQDLSIDDAIAHLIAERSGADAPTMTLTEAVGKLCRLMGCESLNDMVSPEWRKPMDDMFEFSFRLYVWTHLKVKPVGVVEDRVDDAMDRTKMAAMERWDEGDDHAYDPDTVAETFALELGRRPTVHELRQMLTISNEEREVDQNSFGLLGHVADLQRERAERGVPNLTAGDVMSDAINRLDRDRDREP